LIDFLLEESQKRTWNESLSQLNVAIPRATFDHKVLSFDEAKRLSEIYRGCSNDQTFEQVSLNSNQAREILILRNLKLVRRISLIMRNTYKDVEIEDIFQSGVMGLIRAVEKWDPGREFQFSTYATWHIRQSISRFILDNYAPIRIPIYLTDKLARIRNYLVQYLDFFEFEPEPLEAADALEISEAEYLNHKSSLFSFVSYESELQKNSLLYETLNSRDGGCELYSDPQNFIELNFLTEDLHRILDTLSEREAGVIALRFGLIDGVCRPLEDIGKVYGVTRERIRQIEGKTMSKLRHPARTELLREYLEIVDARWETSIPARKRHFDASADVYELDEELSIRIVSSELYCEGW
jgi:RNA polymerase primary sigma factor